MGGRRVESSPVFARQPFVNIDDYLKLWRCGAFQLIFETVDTAVVSMDDFLRPKGISLHTLLKFDIQCSVCLCWSAMS